VWYALLGDEVDGMNKYFAGVFLGFTATVVGWLVIHKPEPEGAPPPPPTAQPGASQNDGPPPSEPAPELSAGGGGGLGASLGAGGADDVLDEDTSRPELGDAPQKITVGIVLVQYHGAEDAKPDARSKSAALSLAKEIAELAREDFSAALKKGDAGSAANAGTIARGVLDPEHEGHVFTLDKGSVSNPIDTPKGYWVVKRLD
jgi:hypothetical protein